MAQTIADIADALLAEAERLLAEGKDAAAAPVAVAAARAWRAAAGLHTLPDGLTVKQLAGKIPGVEHTDQTRKALSERFGDPKDKNMIAARKVGLPSLRALAAAIKAETGNCSASYLSQVAAGKRPLSHEAARAFKKLTGKDWQ